MYIMLKYVLTDWRANHPKIGQRDKHTFYDITNYKWHSSKDHYEAGIICEIRG